MSYDYTTVDFIDIEPPILNFFRGNKYKTAMWFLTDNPLLGGLSPLQMMMNGRTEKLKLFIHTAIDENFRDEL